ncbi:uncharacterized protein LOC131598308 [Vicia villosa]|uniref:uncharacterized protein LOC131598308 n=1 Tax=Vicia villosa TaxID=3911 RepID=UPI00273B46E2|nr:uncharacterized protein LOC131598308 [Vicia villosa]
MTHHSYYYTDCHQQLKPSNTYTFGDKYQSHPSSRRDCKKQLQVSLPYFKKISKKNSQKPSDSKNKQKQKFQKVSHSGFKKRFFQNNGKTLSRLFSRNQEKMASDSSLRNRSSDSLRNFASAGQVIRKIQPVHRAALSAAVNRFDDSFVPRSNFSSVAVKIKPSSNEKSTVKTRACPVSPSPRSPGAGSVEQAETVEAIGAGQLADEFLQGSNGEADNEEKASVLESCSELDSDSDNEDDDIEKKAMEETRERENEDVEAEIVDGKPIIYDLKYFLKLWGENLDYKKGRAIDGMLIVNGFDSNLFTMASVVKWYVNYGKIDDAFKMFDTMPHTDLIEVLAKVNRILEILMRKENLGQFDGKVLTEKLRKLNNSQQSIEYVSRLCVSHRNRAKYIVETWNKLFSSSQKDQRVPFLNLANDIIQTSKRKGNESVNEFWNVLPSALKSAYASDESGKNSVIRLIYIWEEGKIFGSRSQGLKGEIMSKIPLPSSISNRKNSDSNPIKIAKRDAQSLRLKLAIGSLPKKIITALHSELPNEEAVLNKCNDVVCQVDCELENGLLEAVVVLIPIKLSCQMFDRMTQQILGLGNSIIDSFTQNEFVDEVLSSLFLMRKEEFEPNGVLSIENIHEEVVALIPIIDFWFENSPMNNTDSIVVLAAQSLTKIKSENLQSQVGIVVIQGGCSKKNMFNIGISSMPLAKSYDHEDNATVRGICNIMINAFNISRSYVYSRKYGLSRITIQDNNKVQSLNNVPKQHVNWVARGGFFNKSISIPLGLFLIMQENGLVSFSTGYEFAARLRPIEKFLSKFEGKYTFIGMKVANYRNRGWDSVVSVVAHVYTNRVFLFIPWDPGKILQP